MNLDIRFDFERTKRIGFVEAIWGEHKSISQLINVTKKVLKKKEVVFITRITEEKANSLLGIYKNGAFYKDANCLETSMTSSSNMCDLK